MNVYSLEADCDQYQNLTLVNVEQDLEALYQFAGTSIGAAWRPLPVETYEEEVREKRLPSDCPGLFGSLPVFSLRAVKILQPILDGNGELLPLDFEQGEYFAFNITRVVDALNEAGSEIVRFPDGKKVLAIKQFSFVPQKLEGVDIFKLPQQPLGMAFVTDRFVQAVRQSDLVGFNFEWLWASEQRSSSPLLYTSQLQ